LISIRLIVYEIVQTKTYFLLSIFGWNSFLDMFV